MPITPRDKQRLDELYSEHGRTFGGVKEDYFALLYLTRKFKVDVNEIAHQVAFGGDDYGFDAYFIDRQARNLYLYQFKWSENHMLFKTSMERMAAAGLPLVFGSRPQDVKENDLIGYLLKDLNENRNIIERVYVHFVFKGEMEEAERSEGLSARKEDLENKAHLVSHFFGRDVEFVADFISDRPGAKPPPPSQSYEIALEGRVTAKHDGRTMHVGLMPLMDLHNMYRALGQRLFDRNIRASLSPDNTPNRKIRDALAEIVLKESEKPSVFAFRHNGITLAAERVTLRSDSASLYVPRLLNGAQTVSCLARFLEQNADHPALRENAALLREVRVLAKIIEDDPTSDFITQVTISNNQQNPVAPWSLRAMDRRQVDLADKFLQEVKLFYSRQEGAFANLTEEDREELGIEDRKDLRIRPLAQTFLAVQGEINNMSRLPDVFETQSLYEGTFKYSYRDADSRKIVLGYKVGLMLNKALEKLRDALPQKHVGAIPKARNLVWAILIQAILNDRKLQQLREDYGGSLTKEFAFRDVLVQLTGTRVLPLLREILALPAYQQKISQERYDFLRAKEVFKRAMDLARDKWVWKKMSF